MTENISTGTLAAAAALAYKNDPVAQNANDFSSWKKMYNSNGKKMYNVLTGRARRIGTRLRTVKEKTFEH